MILRLLSHLYVSRLMKPQLKERGIDIEAEIEYQQGAFFIVSVNIKSIDWLLFMRFIHFQLLANHLKRRQKQHQRTDDSGSSSVSSSKSIRRSSFSVPSKTKKGLLPLLNYRRKIFPTVFEAIAYALYYLYYFPWFISLLVCLVSYHTFCKELIHKFIIHSVTDGKIVIHFQPFCV